MKRLLLIFVPAQLVQKLLLQLYAHSNLMDLVLNPLVLYEWQWLEPLQLVSGN